MTSHHMTDNLLLAATIVILTIHRFLLEEELYGQYDLRIVLIKQVVLKHTVGLDTLVASSWLPTFFLVDEISLLRHHNRYVLQKQSHG